jgi:transcriptional regulator with XRE-family HTH domain
MTVVDANGSKRRYCMACGARLATDNSASFCSPCGYEPRRNGQMAPRFGAEFWRTDQMRDALATRDMGIVLGAYRTHPAHGRRPLPQSQVARWLGITQGQLSRIEAGRNHVRDLEKLVRYALRLRVPAQLLWFDVGGDAIERDPGRATDLVRLPGGPPVPAATAGVEPTLAESLLVTLDQYAITDNLTGPRSLLPIVTQQMTFVEDLFARSRGRARSRLVYVAARFAEFTGWLYQDSGDTRAAMQWSNTAADFAQEAGDADLVSYTLMRKSNIAGDAGNAELVLKFAGAALQQSKSLTPRLRAVALRQQAHGHALSGNSAACERAIDQALQQAADGQGETDLAIYCTPSYVDMEAAHCWVELGQPERALVTLRQGLADWQPEFRRDLGLCLARLAVAHAKAGQADDALTVAQQSLRITATTHSQRTVRQLRRTTELLTATGDQDHAQHLRYTLRTAVR